TDAARVTTQTSIAPSLSAPPSEDDALPVPATTSRVHCRTRRRWNFPQLSISKLLERFRSRPQPRPQSSGSGTRKGVEVQVFSTALLIPTSLSRTCGRGKGEGERSRRSGSRVRRGRSALLRVRLVS